MKRVLPWAVAAALTVACFAFQNRTGPTYPLEGTVRDRPRGRVRFKFLRSEEIGTPLQLMLRDPVPAGVTGQVRWRRYKSHDGWSDDGHGAAGTFRFTRRGDGRGGARRRRQAAVAARSGPASTSSSSTSTTGAARGR